jgi:predicted phosphodiesterase
MFRLRRLFASHVLVRLALLAGLSFAAWRLVAPTVFHFRSGDLTVRLAPDVPGGRTTLELGPLGQLSWPTHKTPVDVDATFVLHPNVDRLPDLSGLRDIRVAFLLRRLPWVLLCGLLAGALLAEGMGRRTPVAAFVGAAAACALAGGLVLATILTFDPHALAHPRYAGPIEDAPRVLELLKEAQHDFAGVQRNINAVAIGLERIHAQLLDNPSPPDPGASGSTRFLVISDLHNNPLGLMIAKQLVERFHVDAVLDAGDFTDRGTALEGDLFARFGSLGVPDVTVAGNHEDIPALVRIRQVPGVRLLSHDGTDVTTVAGITVLGDDDPNSETIVDNPFDPVAIARFPERCAALAQRWAQATPDVVLVHDPRLGACAEAAAEKAHAPLVYVWGHLHRPAYEEHGSVVSLSPGTSGANGIKSAKPGPYGFALLEFDPSRRLSSACEFLFAAPGALEQASCHMAPASSERE